MGLPDKSKLKHSEARGLLLLGCGCRSTIRLAPPLAIDERKTLQSLVPESSTKP